MAKQRLVFDVVASPGPVEVKTTDGVTLVAPTSRQDPVAIHDSVGFPAMAQQTVTNTVAGYAFRAQMTAAKAAALRDALLAGLGTSWLLDWLEPADMSAAEQSALQTLLTSHPDDFFGELQVTVTAPTYPADVVLCNQDANGPKYAFTVASGAADLFVGIQPGTYDVYADNGSNVWSVPQVTVFTQGATAVRTFNTFSPVNPQPPCL